MVKAQRHEYVLFGQGSMGLEEMCIMPLQF
jgi:hypothetical protein